MAGETVGLADRGPGGNRVRACPTMTSADSSKPSIEGGNEQEPKRVSRMPPINPPVAMAEFHTVVTSACPRSTPSPAASADGGTQLRARSAERYPQHASAA